MLNFETLRPIPVVMLLPSSMDSLILSGGDATNAGKRSKIIIQSFSEHL